MSARLVIAEDEEGIRQNLTRMLRLEGFEVWAGENGRLALELVQRHAPDLVISDLMMPELSGDQLILALRADPRTAHIPVVLLTARADRSDVRAGMELGADDYLTKPFQRDELLRSVRARLDKAAGQRLAAQRLAEQTHNLAHFDAATRLPNRNHWQLLLGDLLTGLPPGPPQALALVVGLDNLPQLAQVLRAGALETLVHALSQRLREAPGLAVLPRCTVGRLAEDRFALFVMQPHGLAAQQAADHLLAHLGAAIEVDGEAHFPVVSVGALPLAAEAASAMGVMGQLEQALAMARRQSGRRVWVLNDGEQAEAGAALRLHNDMHLAVARGELRAWYQPQLDAHSGALVGFEALMRWQHPTHGLVFPSVFIPLAEDNGQIVPMGAWMLERACADLLALQRGCAPDAPPLRVAVNLSLRQFCDPQVFEHVAQALARSGLAPTQLELEITEGTAMVNQQHTLELLGRFKQLGCMLALDDFGTGYSSLAYLKRFPLDVMKIDQSFVRHILSDKEDRAIVHAIITLAHHLGMKVIAEGVEQAAQQQLLASMGCELVQGYLHGRPMPLDEALAWVQAHQRPLIKRT